MKKNVMLIIALMVPNMAYSKDFNKQYAHLIKDMVWAADIAEIPRELLMAICWGESNYRVHGVTHLDGDTISHSICQVKLATAQFLDNYYRHKVKATAERLETPRINAFYAAKWLKYQLDRYNDNWKLAVDAYNKGTAVSSKSEYVERFLDSLDFIRNNVSPKHIYVGNRLKELN